MVSSLCCVYVCACAYVCTRAALLKANLQRSQRRSCVSRSELSRRRQEAYLHLQCQRWGQTGNSSQLLTFYFCKHLFIFFINLVTPIVGQRVALDRVWHIVEKIWMNKSVSWVEIEGGGGGWEGQAGQPCCSPISCVLVHIPLASKCFRKWGDSTASRQEEMLSICLSPNTEFNFN